MKTSSWIRPAALLIALAAAPLAAEGQQNVRLAFQLIEANGFEDTDPAIAGVVEELRELFRFRGYRLLDTSVLRGALHDGPESTVVGQRLVLGEVGTFDLQAFLTRTQSPNTFRVDVRLRQEDGGGIMDASVSPRSGQTVVLGSARPNGAAGALILVMTAQLDE